MPFSTAFDAHPIVERVQRVRQTPIAAYGSTILLVGLAVLGRWAVGDYVGAHVPFISFYPAIIAATLLGGLWPGVVAAILSSLAAWYLFLPPLYSWTLEERELVQLLLFIFISGVNLTIIVLLNALVDRVMAQEQNMRVLFESAPNGIVVVDEQGEIKLINASTEKLFGYERLELLGQSVEVLVPDGNSTCIAPSGRRFCKSLKHAPWVLVVISAVDARTEVNFQLRSVSILSPATATRLSWPRSSTYPNASD